MKRREFARTIGAGVVGAAAGAVAARAGHAEVAVEAQRGGAAQPAKKPVLLKIGCQSRTGTTQKNLEFLARHGVYHMNPGNLQGKTLEDVKRDQDAAAKYGISIGAYHLPLTSSGISSGTRLRLTCTPSTARAPCATA